MQHLKNGNDFDGKVDERKESKTKAAHKKVKKQKITGGNQ